MRIYRVGGVFLRNRPLLVFFFVGASWGFSRGHNNT
ncbi:unnamed protein product [Acanthoscelides obtectus]|uniref:Uncharacterized protein n=1 Tax=Acanthoscelides obtectus TaxID=200917 RepID=A0A9P0LZX6_ACAOB|nr:unnamed protein product [Acanthoscelides obtectus]CAK1656585.1 hypothetical protein AOBTE_LOCUS19816 [Acanthoscelides obtectus]